MKRVSIFIMSLCCALFLAAETIDRQAALYTARAYMLAKGKTVVAPSKSSRAKASGETEEAYYYVFNAGNDGGYVIVSGDDRVEPILGYVEQGSFDPDNIPENMRSWLQLYADEIKYIVENDIQPNDPIIRKRNKVSGTKHSVPELMKSRWNQGHPYNLTCPQYYKGDGSRAYSATGCAATAMAQVINFYKYPARTKALIPAHSKTYTLNDSTQKTVTAKAVPRNTKIDWENMRETYSCGSDHVHDKPDTAVANLMLYCGQALKMGWGASSGADTSKSRDALVNYFGFDSRAYWASRPNYGIDEWFDMLYDEMEAGYPVLYRGHSSGGGHAFVIDGFDGDNLFHVNWGWGGGSNGWFLIGILNPGDTSGMGASSSSDGYSMTQGGVFNLRIPGTPKDDVYLSISDVSITDTNIKAKFTNRNSTSNIFNTGIVTLDEYGKYVLVGSKQTISGMGAGASSTKTFQISGHLTEGTYKLSPASKLSKSDVWRPEYNMRDQYIEAVVDSTGAVDLHFLYPNQEDLRIDTIVFPGTRIAGKEQEVKVTFHNFGAEYFKVVYLHVSKSASNTSKDTYSGSKSMVAVRSGETVDVSYFFKPTETGTYKIWLCTAEKGAADSNNEVIGQTTMQVITEAEAVQANLAVDSYTIQNASDGYVYGKRLIGKATIKNKGSQVYHANVKLQLWSQKVGSSTAYSGSTRSYAVEIEPDKTGTVEFEFDGLSEGYYYHIKAMYSNQEGTLGSGGIWDHKWEMKAGMLTWKNDGTVEGRPYKSSFQVSSSSCGIYANCNKINRMTPNNSNKNTIYAFAAGMDAPKGLDNSNTVYGSHADQINLVNGKPYYIPVSFDADSASFTYTFPATEDGTKWHAFTMPFASDSILLDDALVTLDDTLKHFWIYEFTAESNNGEVVFAPATRLLAGTPYIIAADSLMAGRSLVFCSTNVPFYKTGTDKMLVTSPNFKFHGNTLAPKVKNCYVMNEEGTAFEYTTTLKTLDAMASYFTTTLSDEEMPASIQLPEIPLRPIIETTLDEMAAAPVVAGTYDRLTLKRTFDAGWNTICLPFAVNNIERLFGEEAKAYEFCGFVNNELDFSVVESLEEGQPYIIYVPNAITEDFVLYNVRIDEASTHPGLINKSGACFRGTYDSTISDVFSMELRKLTVDGTLEEYASGEVINGFRAFFRTPSEDATLHFYDDPTGIKTIVNKQTTEIYNLAGQRLGKMQNQRSTHVKGIYIMNGKKVLK